MVQGPNYRLATIMSAAPFGSLFRNCFYTGWVYYCGYYDQSVSCMPC
jgi:hypothetical protein